LESGGGTGEVKMEMRKGEDIHDSREYIPLIQGLSLSSHPVYQPPSHGSSSMTSFPSGKGTYINMTNPFQINRNTPS
jgi:hypothetical protein